MTTPDTLPDHGARDAAIAISSYTTVVGREAVPEDAFRAYWRDVHGPLCSRVPGLGHYVQHHFAARRDAHLWEGPDDRGPVPGYALDGAVEIGWADAGTQAVFQDASSILSSDEQNVFEETAAYALPTGSVTVLDRVVDPIPNGTDAADRMHVHFTPVHGQRDALADLLLHDLADAARASSEVLAYRVHAPEPHDDSTPNPPAPNVRHTLDADRIDVVILEVAFTDALARRRFFASDAYRATLSRQAELSTAITPFPVSGVFTFVRDGELTTAGLRGSRVAELITALAARNQVEEPVVGLMRTGRIAATD